MKLRELKVLRQCDCGKCRHKIYELEQYRGFSLELHPYGKGNDKQVRAILISKQKLDEVLLNSDPFGAYEYLVDDTAHSRKPKLKVEEIVKFVKKTIDNYWKVREQIVWEIKNEVSIEDVSKKKELPEEENREKYWCYFGEMAKDVMLKPDKTFRFHITGYSELNQYYFKTEEEARKVLEWHKKLGEK